MGSESAGVGSRLAIGKVRVETDGGQGATKVNEDDIIGVVRESIPSMFVPAWKITLRPFIPTGRPRGKLLNVPKASDTPLSAMPMSLAWWRL